MPTRILRKTDFRQFSYRVNPVSDAHHDVIKDMHIRIESYFKDRPECQADRKIYSSNSNRYYTIVFATIDDSKMFELVFAEHIDTQGVKYE
jgi:hypothetical protein